MSERDIRIACELIALRMPHLRQPATICTRRIKIRSRCLGQYRFFSDTMRLHPRYLARLDEERALELLDTVLHEILHKNSSPLRQLRDTLFAHPGIYAEAARLARVLAAEFLAMRQGEAASAGARAAQQPHTPEPSTTRGASARRRTMSRAW
jgi:hypothetical protein